MLHFYGYVNDQPAELIQNISQLNFLITSIKKADDTKPPRRLGFHMGSEDTN